jgi:WD repeat-containing protein 59
LLYGDENESKQAPVSIKSDTSDEDDEFMPAEKRTGEDITATLLMTSKNLAEPRSSQGVFSPNGMFRCCLSCFASSETIF